MQFNNTDQDGATRLRALHWSATIAVAVLAACTVEAAGEKTLYAFNPWPPPGAVAPGTNPRGTLLRDRNGALYGTTMLGGPYYNGAVFKLTPPVAGYTEWTMSVIYTFTGGTDGGTPHGNLVMDSSGAIYGTASSGGSWLNQGLVFKLAPPASGYAQWTYSVLHWFYHSSAFDEADGANPSGGLVMDASGALYGTTDLGGYTKPIGSDYGTVFKLTPLDAAKTSWQETVLYRFAGGADGANPMDALALDTEGNLYGTTLYGGAGPCYKGCGIVFRLSPPPYEGAAWTKTTLHTFDGGPGGGAPQGKLLIAFGALFGATFKGGTGPCTDGLLYPIGCGVVYRLAPPAAGQAAWQKSILVDFQVTNGFFPQGGVIADSNALYGTASQSAPSAYGVPGDGLVYKLTPPAQGRGNWTQTILHTFDVRTSGSVPLGELVRGPDGHLFGTTYMGGGLAMGGSGTIFEILP